MPAPRHVLLAVVAAVLLALAARWAAGGDDLETTLGLRSSSLPGDVVHFDEIQAAHFRALTVDREQGNPTGRPLLVRLDVVGPAPDTSRAERWLRENANVHVVRDPSGAPLVFTDKDLATDRGTAAIGATVPRGIAVETREATLVDCVVVHEILHFLGLHHVDDKDDIMAARCESDKPWKADFGERAKLDRLQGIKAMTLTGRLTWAERI